MAEGAFQTEQAAAEASQSGEFIVQVAVDARFPEQAVDAEKLYFPRAETWEQSALYRMRND